MVIRIKRETVFPWPPKVKLVIGDYGASLKMYYSSEESPILLFRDAMKTTPDEL